ncbi:hypothetical protein E2562_015420 [Oryza meyeriana var. granulata]|uniref:Uncharacterized protein n=1 Tax=Oryza meyeriana var. granulata TaxID=110450 RepID=A0A6G1EKM9_9ORYZ|nr:hypothetical protein E2562_015420 [Oryza meyeriana var. granulata]KAF0925147.1 hypothetical protein E2562_015420 [Oryza meyeriana var. granulata]
MDRRGGGGGGGGNRNRTDLLAAGRQKLQQFRKKKEKRGPGKKAEAKADAEAEEGSSKSGADAEEVVPEPKSPVGLKLLAGEGGGSHYTPFEEATRSQVEQCNGQGTGTAESCTIDNAEVLPVEEGGDGCNAQDVGVSEHGSLEHESAGPGDSEGPTVPVTGADGSDDLIEGAQPLKVDADEELPGCSLKENMELCTSSQGDIADDNGDNQLGEDQQVEINPVERPTSSDSKEITEITDHSQGIGAVNTSKGEEGSRETEIDVSGRPSGAVAECEGELNVRASHEASESTAREGTDRESDALGEEAVQEDPGTTNDSEEVVAVGAVTIPLHEKTDQALLVSDISQCMVPYHFEDIQRHLYLVTLSRDFLQLQLDEGADLNSDVPQWSYNEAINLQVLLEETEKSKQAVCEELQHCRHELSDMNTVKEELELTVASLKDGINTSNNKCECLEFELHSSKENTQQILNELAGCRAMLEALQKENLELTANLSFEKEARKEVEEQRDHLSDENKKILSSLSDLELSLASLKEEMNEGSNRCANLECELRSSKENMEHTLVELASCRASLETLQKDNLELSANSSFEKEANKKLEEDNLCLSNEKQSLLLELAETKEKLHLSYAKHKQLESHTRDMETYFGQLREQLIEESLYTSNSVDIYQTVIKELNAKCKILLHEVQNAHQENEPRLDSSEIIVENAERETTSPEFVDDDDNQRSLQLVTENDSCSSTALQSLKSHMKMAKGDLNDLQKLVERISSRSDGRVLVSKLIQSFESKGNQEDLGMSEGEHDNLQKLTQEMICRLVEKLKTMTSDIARTEEYVAELCNRLELSVKSMSQHEAEREQTAVLVAKMDGFAGKLSNYKDTIDQLLSQVASVHQDADNHAGRLIDQAEILQSDVTERISALEKERASLTDVLIEVTNRLSALRDNVLPNDLGGSESLGSLALSSVDFTAKLVQSLLEKLEDAQSDNAKLNASLVELKDAHSDVQERSEHAHGIVKNMYTSLQELLCNSLGNLDVSGVEYNADKPIEDLFSQYGGIVEHLKSLLHERQCLLSKNTDLESRLLSKCEETEALSSSLTKCMNDFSLLNEELKTVSLSRTAAQDELHGRCLAIAEKMVHRCANRSSTVLPLMAYSEVEMSSKEHRILTTLLPCIEEGVASYIEEFENMAEEIRLSKICLQESNIVDQSSSEKWSLPLPVLIKEEIVPIFFDLQGRIDQLSTLNIQLETEVPVLRDGLAKLDGALETSRAELQKKVFELEQSEQKLSSVKEKLSIAVAKGKGLIVQRDGLKQTLLEKSGELEKLSHELQSKDALLIELEAKIKSYADADRIEALESELSYIRNSATALRDSFLQKDSVLQRIEEVLEDLDLPEHFHFRDIVEKIELLSKMAVGASFTVPDGNKQSSVDGNSESGAAIDSTNDEQNSNSNSGSEEIKIKYDELHRRFYELAEHNNMLEQSLVERNNLIQKWEEVLGQISIPPQFRMLEPEDRIAWLGNRLMEVEHERDALRLKIEHLEDSSEMLISDLEESHKRISELSAEIVAIKVEKEFFSQSLEKLRFDFLGLSEKAVQDEFVRDNLRKDLAELQEKLAEKTEESKHYHDMEMEIDKLLDLVRDALQDDSNTELPSGAGAGAAVLCLGGLLSKLIDEYRAHLSESTVGSPAEMGTHLETKLSKDASTSEMGMEDKEMALNTLSDELEHARNSLALVEQQRDEAVEKTQSLTMELETLRAQINKLQGDGAEQMNRYQSLMLELESLTKQRDDLQEKLSQEEQKCTSLREKLNVAVRKGKGLVQHRDSLKQTMEEMNTMIEKLKDERKQHIESLESERSSLMGRLAENEKSLHDATQYLSRLLNSLSTVDIGREFDTDPIAKVEKISDFCLDLQNEVKKSKQATELLLAELNEVHERADNLQDELVKAESALSESSRQNNVVESARADAVRHLEYIMHMQSQTRRKQIDHLMELNSTSSQLREIFSELLHHLVNRFSKDVDIINYMESFVKSSDKWMDSTSMVEIPIASNNLLSNSTSSKKAHIPNVPLEITLDNADETQILHHLATACHAVADCVNDCNDLRRRIHEHGFSVDQKAAELFDVMSNLQNNFTSQNNELESLRENIVELQSEIKQRDEEILSMRRNMSLLYEACTISVAEIEGMTGIESGDQNCSIAQNHLSADDHIKSVANQLVAAIKTTQNSNEGNTKELKATVLELQQELQEKHIQISTISAELASQVREAESSAKQLSVELENARMEVHNLEKQSEMLLNQKKDLETQVSELKDMEAGARDQHERIKELSDELSRKDQEIEGLMQALDEEERELEVLENKSNDLEKMLQEKEFALKSLEVSRTKALTKLATTVDKFDELHSLSESLLAEVENLQSQLQERDSEISFLRQEITRSTNELLTTEESNKKYSSQINDFTKWLETALLQFGVHCESTNDYECTRVPVYMDMLEKKIGSLISESDELRVTLQSKGSLLQAERTKMEELLRKSEALESSLSQKDSQIGLLRRDRTSGQPSRFINLPGTSEIEQVNDKVSPAAVVTQIRGARKVNTDQVAIDVEVEKDKPLDDEDDDKAHGFKSLTMSHIVPKFTRPISDRIDGMWVSGDRLLMRQPTLRLGVLLYWIVLHALLASFI